MNPFGFEGVEPPEYELEMDLFQYEGSKLLNKKRKGIVLAMRGSNFLNRKRKGMFLAKRCRIL